MIGLNGMEYDPAVGLVLLDNRPAPAWKVSLLDDNPEQGWCAEFLLENGMEIMLFVQADLSDVLRPYLCVAFTEDSDEEGVNILVEDDRIIIRPCRTLLDRVFGDWTQTVKDGAEVWEWLDRLSRMPVERE